MASAGAPVYNGCLGAEPQRGPGAAGADPGVKQGGGSSRMASAGARANGGLGRSPQRGPGAEPLVRGSGAKPPEAEKLPVF